MSLLKKEYWFISLIVLLVCPHIFILILASDLNLIDKNGWYSKWQYWFIGCICLFFPLFLLFLVFETEMLVKVSQKLKVPGSEIYTIPYIWILLLIVPVVGWILLFVMYIYLHVWTVVMLHNGNGEKIKMAK